MDAYSTTHFEEWLRINFKIDDDICKANIFPTYPYITFTNIKWEMIEWTWYEFSTQELIWKAEELRDLSIDFIKKKWRSIIE